jgi:murein peptide amidase A
MDGSTAAQRFGKNQGGYFGECIDIRAVLDDARAAATEHRWNIETLVAREGVELLVLRRAVNKPTRRIYISAGIHGDEPAGPLAARELLRANDWPDCADIWLCPCLNPTGFPLNKRKCALGKDLNRDYRHGYTGEIAAHITWLKQQPNFDVCFCLHEDWEAHGFYVYELNPDSRPSLAETIIRAAREVGPIDHSPIIDGREAKEGVIRPNLDPALRPDWPEAFYLITHKTRQSYTLETPSDFPLNVRVTALVTAVRAAVAASCARS